MKASSEPSKNHHWFERTFIVVIAILFSSCDPSIFLNCNHDYYFDKDNALIFSILDDMDQNVLELITTNYNYDTVKIYSTGWEKVYPIGEWYATDGVINLRFIDRVDKGIVNERLARRFYMYFNRNDIDTIDIEFQMKYDKKCKDQIIDYFKVSYNKDLYYDDQTDHVPNMTFIKVD